MVPVPRPSQVSTGAARSPHRALSAAAPRADRGRGTKIPAARSAEVSAPLIEGETCWRTAHADRVALLVDAQAYFAAAEGALREAERSILLIGWHFDSRTRLRPFTPDPTPIGHLLIRLARERPELKVRVLIWNMALAMSAGFEFYPGRARATFVGTGVSYHLDRTAPFGASHHQKLLVVDDKIAFIGGGDFSVDRWDTARHLDEDPRRMDPDGDFHPPRHEVMAMVDGDAARLIGDVARERWCRGTGETLKPVVTAGDPWPDMMPSSLEDVTVAVSRTRAAHHTYSPLRESEALHLAAIASARHTIYLENQYVTSRVIAEALAVRLAEPDGPEVTVISTRQSPSWFDRVTMDRTRDGLIERLREADVHGRFSAWCPLTPGGGGVIVHSKVSVIDDRLLRVGSTNLNNRSLGFDTECDLVVQAETEAQRDAVRTLRDRLIGHFLGCTGAAFSEAVNQFETLEGAIRAMNRRGRLEALKTNAHGPFGKLVAAWQMGDPISREDSFRPWRRRRLAEAAGERARLAVSAAVLKLEVHPQRQVVGGQPHQRGVGGLDVQHADPPADEQVVDAQDRQA